jgi:hypothetical protein
MDLLAKTVLAFCIGVGAMAGIQTLYLRSVTELVRSEAARPSAALPEMKPAFSFDASKLGTAIIPKVPEIDTSAGQRAAINSLSRQIDQQIRGAQSAVPVPRTYPGMPRY